MTPANPPFIQETIDFVKVMLPHCSEPEKTVQWHMQNMAIVLDRDVNKHKAVQGVGLYRRVDDPEQARDRWKHNPNGKLLWVDWTVSLLHGGLGRMIKPVFETLGRPTHIGFSRHKHFDRMSIYPASFFDRLARMGL
jgi:hypothetical protein